MQDKKPTIRELYLLNKHFESWWLPIDDNTYLYYFMDITQIKENEEKYKNLQEFLRTLTDLIPDLIWAKDTHKKCLFANKAMCEKLPYAKDTNEPLGKTDLFFAQRIKAEKSDDPNYNTFGERCQDSDQVIIDTRQIGRFDEYGTVRGKYLHLDVIKVPWFDNSGNLVSIIGVARDVTQEKLLAKQIQQYQLQLQYSELYHKAIFENNPAGILIVNQERIIIDTNPAILKTLGFKKDELIGKNVSIIHLDSTAYDRFGKEVAKVFENQNESITLGYNFKKKDGQTIWAELTGTQIILPDNTKAAAWSAIDTTQKYILKKQLEYQSQHDPLTNLYNRYTLNNEMEMAMQRSIRYKTTMAVCMIDLDNFKPINDKFGHWAGDSVLKTIAHRLQLMLRKSDFISRLGGDEFVIIFENIKNSNQLPKIFETIHEAVTQEIEIKKGVFVNVGLSMGVVLYPKAKLQTVDELLRGADMAMYKSKQNKQNREQFYSFFCNNKDSA